RLAPGWHHTFAESAQRWAQKGCGLTTLHAETGRVILPHPFAQTHLRRRRLYHIVFQSEFYFIQMHESDRPPLTGSDPYVRVGRKEGRMPRNRHTVEQIITKLREAEVALSKGQPVAQACRTLGITEQLRDELLNRELFATLWEVRVLVERWRRHYNQIRPHRALGLRPPAPETIAPQHCA